MPHKKPVEFFKYSQEFEKDQDKPKLMRRLGAQTTNAKRNNDPKAIKFFDLQKKAFKVW